LRGLSSKINRIKADQKRLNLILWINDVSIQSSKY
jgi:hypothetical protein